INNDYGRIPCRSTWHGVVQETIFAAGGAEPRVDEDRERKGSADRQTRTRTESGRRASRQTWTRVADSARKGRTTDREDSATDRGDKTAHAGARLLFQKGVGFGAREPRIDRVRDQILRTRPEAGTRSNRGRHHIFRTRPKIGTRSNRGRHQILVTSATARARTY